MSLILKTNVSYTGISKALNMLELATTSESKLEYIKGVLDKLNVNTSTLNASKASAIHSSAIAHMNKIASQGATILSLPYTLKAFFFLHKHNLTSDDYLAFSPMFGVRMQNGYVEHVYGLNDYYLYDNQNSKSLLVDELPNGVYAIKKNVDNEDHARMYYRKIGVSKVTGLSLSRGYILGSSFRKDKATVLNITPPRFMLTTSSALDNLANKIHYKGSANNIGRLYITTSTGISTYSDIVSFQQGEYHGVAALFLNGSDQSKLYLDDVEVISNTAGKLTADLSDKTIEPSFYYLNDEAAVNYPEVWAINSASTAVAKDLSSHLSY